MAAHVEQHYGLFAKKLGQYLARTGDQEILGTLLAAGPRGIAMALQCKEATPDFVRRQVRRERVKINSGLQGLTTEQVAEIVAAGGGKSLVALLEAVNPTQIPLWAGEISLLT
jgi:hypothetical protein